MRHLPSCKTPGNVPPPFCRGWANRLLCIQRPPTQSCVCSRAGSFFIIPSCWILSNPILPHGSPPPLWARAALAPAGPRKMKCSVPPPGVPIALWPPAHRLSSAHLLPGPAGEYDHWKECEICNRKKDEASHTYNQEMVTPEALKSAADCVNPAAYYKSCVRGKISTNDSDTFTSGNALAHDLTHHAATAATCTQTGNREY